MNQRLSPLLCMLIALMALGTMGSSCQHGSGSKGTPTPQLSPANSTPTPIDDISNIDANKPNSEPGPEEGFILSVQKDVSLRRLGTDSFVPIFSKIAFRIGDLLQIGNDSFANVYCLKRDQVCKLPMGRYSSCCGDSCAAEIQMLRASIGTPLPTVKKADLPEAEAMKLNQSETAIRQLNLGPVATQFLITKLYSGWKLEETNQQLEILTNQLQKPEAKDELKDLYQPLLRKTGDMHLKINQIDKAKELYEININAANGDAKEKAAAHERLAQAYNQGGDKTEAVKNLETAKTIYVQQGDTKAATITDKEISHVKLQNLNTIPKTKVIAPAPK